MVRHFDKHLRCEKLAGCGWESAKTETPQFEDRLVLEQTEQVSISSAGQILIDSTLLSLKT